MVTGNCQWRHGDIRQVLASPAVPRAVPVYEAFALSFSGTDVGFHEHWNYRQEASVPNERKQNCVNRLHDPLCRLELAEPFFYVCHYQHHQSEPTVANYANRQQEAPKLGLVWGCDLHDVQHKDVRHAPNHRLQRKEVRGDRNELKELYSDSRLDSCVSPRPNHRPRQRVDLQLLPFVVAKPTQNEGQHHKAQTDC